MFNLDWSNATFLWNHDANACTGIAYDGSSKGLMMLCDSRIRARRISDGLPLVQPDILLPSDILMQSFLAHDFVLADFIWTSFAPGTLSQLARNGTVLQRDIEVDNMGWLRGAWRLVRRDRHHASSRCRRAAGRCWRGRRRRRRRGSQAYGVWLHCDGDSADLLGHRLHTSVGWRAGAHRRLAGVRPELPAGDSHHEAGDQYAARAQRRGARDNFLPVLRRRRSGVARVARPERDRDAAGRDGQDGHLVSVWPRGVDQVPRRDRPPGGPCADPRHDQRRHWHAARHAQRALHMRVVQRAVGRDALDVRAGVHRPERLRADRQCAPVLRLGDQLPPRGGGLGRLGVPTLRRRAAGALRTPPPALARLRPRPSSARRRSASSRTTMAAASTFAARIRTRAGQQRRAAQQRRRRGLPHEQYARRLRLWRRLRQLGPVRARASDAGADAGAVARANTATDAVADAVSDAATDAAAAIRHCAADATTDAAAADAIPDAGAADAVSDAASDAAPDAAADAVPDAGADRRCAIRATRACRRLARRRSTRTVGAAAARSTVATIVPTACRLAACARATATRRRSARATLRLACRRRRRLAARRRRAASARLATSAPAPARRRRAARRAPGAR
jgi:hypothetical protein